MTTRTDTTGDVPHLVVVDLETTGFDPADGHFAVSAAWWDLDTGDRGAFIPQHTWEQVVGIASPEALRVNRYLDTIHGREQDNEFTATARMWAALSGTVMAGSNPAFDWSHLPALFRPWVRTEQGNGWRVLAESKRRKYSTPTLATHRLLDLAAYAAGRLAVNPAALPGLRSVCALLGVDGPDHTAVGDVTATGACLLRLRDDEWVAHYLGHRERHTNHMAARLADDEVPGPAAAAVIAS